MGLSLGGVTLESWPAIRSTLCGNFLKNIFGDSVMDLFKERLALSIWGATGTFVVFFGIVDPSLIWLGTGDFAERDLFWLFGTGCDISIWFDIGSGAADACRVSSLFFTEAVGLNRILNWVCDLNITFLWFISFTIWLFYPT